MKPAELTADPIGDLFDLDVQAGPLHTLPRGSMDSEDCTNDTCTQTCSGCAGGP